MRRFHLVRKEDVSGISGTGIVAEGCQFSKSGQCVLVWKTDHSSLAVYKNIEDVVFIHGHAGATECVWIDDEYHDIE